MIHRVRYYHLLIVVGFVSSLLGMEESAPFMGQGFDISEVAQIRDNALIEQQQVDQALLVFKNILANQQHQELFSAFTRAIVNAFGMPWREAVPLLTFDLTRRILLEKPSALVTSITLDDFLAAGKPYFLSYDAEGAPFIAFVFKKYFHGNYGNIRIQLFYFDIARNNWHIRGAPCYSASKDSFTNLAKLLYQGEADMAYEEGYKLVSLDEIETLHKEEQARQEIHRKLDVTEGNIAETSEELLYASRVLEYLSGNKSTQS